MLHEMNQVSGGNIGISYKPEAVGFGFSYGRDFMHVNGFGTFSSQ
ncbi:hypothetical protein [Neisseria yangbaofengii]|nr:hypothetical protein [Neisseria yangbaofengii]